MKVSETLLGAFMSAFVTAAMLARANTSANKQSYFYYFMNDTSVLLLFQLNVAAIKKAYSRIKDTHCIYSKHLSFCKCPIFSNSVIQSHLFRFIINI